MSCFRCDAAGGQRCHDWQLIGRRSRRISLCIEFRLQRVVYRLIGHDRLHLIHRKAR